MLRVLLVVSILIAVLVSDPVDAQDEDPPADFSAPIGSPDFVAGQVIVKFSGNLGARSLTVAALEALPLFQGIKLTGVDPLPLINAVVVEVDESTNPSAVQQIIARFDTLSASDRQGIEYVELNYLLYADLTPNDPLYGPQWGFSKIDAPKAWDRIVNADTVIVAVIDTGIDFNHSDLQQNMWVNADERPNDNIDNDGNGIVDDVFGARFTGGVSGNPTDDNGHGSHVAGTIGAVTDNNDGVAGTTWRVQLMAVKFLRASGSGSTTDAIKGIAYALDNGANIMNNSWGGGGWSRALRDCIRQVERRGVLFVAAAGNSNVNTDNRPHYPSGYDVSNILSVMSTTRSDSKSGFSNFGSVTVDLAAPGSDILSTVPGNWYDSFSGTSMAAPHVSGAAALLKAVNPHWTYREIKQNLMITVDKLPSLRGMSQTEGRLNLGRNVSSPVEFDMPDLPSGLLAGQTAEVRWKSVYTSPFCSAVDIDISVNGGQVYDRLISATPNDGSEPIVTPSSPATEAHLKLTCTDTHFETVSVVFALFAPIRVIKPSADTVWYSGYNNPVEWTGATDSGGPPNCQTVRVMYSKDGGQTFPFVLVRQTENTGQTTIKAPELCTRRSHVKVSCIETTHYDTTDNAFRTCSLLGYAFCLFGTFCCQ